MYLSAAWLVGLVLCTTTQQPLDAFDSPDAAAAAAWKAGERTEPVSVSEDAGRRVLQLPASFAKLPKLNRAVIDRKVQLDLAGPGEFHLEIAVEPIEAASSVTLYFHSGKGWFGCGGNLKQPGWQTVKFSKASFGREESPAGWDQIDGIRIAVWRAQPQDAVIRIRGLSAHSRPVALVVPSGVRPGDRKRGDGELRAAQESATVVAGMLEDLGLGCDAVDDASLTRGALGQRKVAIVAYDPHPAEDAVAALARFVESGGKLVLCYTLPPRLAEVLGFGKGKYFRPERPGTLAEMRFEAPQIAGLPKIARQTSWNITLAEPRAHGAKVVGRWFDDAGKETGHPALLVSDRGAFFSHVLLPQDADAKRQLLAAVLGHLESDLWRTMATTTFERAGQIGHLENLAQLKDFIAAQKAAAAEKKLATAVALEGRVRQQMNTQAWQAAFETARALREAAAAAYLAAHSGRTPEGRATWNHSGMGAYPGDWERSIKELKQAGFNMVLPNMLWGGLAHYPSDILPRSEVFRKHGDQIAQCLSAARTLGLEVHVWKVNWNLSNAPAEFVAQMEREGRLATSVQGQTDKWLCPSHPKNQQLELESMCEVARMYDVDGLHFDYIRYHGSNFCFCGGCRERFEAQLGLKVEHWPADCHSGSLKEEYVQWRCDQITKLVAAVHREAKKIRPNVKISAAVFGSYPDCRYGVCQDWLAWVKAGYLDFLCPMDYTPSDRTFTNLVQNQLKLVEGRLPLYPGIGATASRSSLTADRVAGQVLIARQLGAGGFTMFNYQESTSKDILPGLGLGIGKPAATPPHVKIESKP